MDTNLHSEYIRTDGQPTESIIDWSSCTSPAKFDHFEVVLRDQENRLIEIIRQYEKGAIFGCVAWLTSIPILKALSKCKNVQIIVQKEDFLRPDVNVRNRDTWKAELQQHYKHVYCDFARFELRKPICNLSVCCDPTVEGIRCVGNYNSDKNPAFPRMHHKFLVFCEVDNNKTNGFAYEPVAVWTGSFNLTRNATMSFENNIFFVDKSGQNPAVRGYLFEHHQLFALSEPLNWSSKWVEPEFRIGT